ncbi:helix-turn-helix domain-containing protein [Candidatus Woesearchaeota archaeon]|nr:helix-turn-helix domain-containing protein [Candidatus Woesearchaeota archaeon]
MKAELLERVGMLLLRNGFTVKCLPRSSFDIVARKDSKILIVKVLQDANSISSELAREMTSIASFLSAAPVVVSEKAGADLEDGIVYSRFGVYAVSFSTFEDCVEDRLPFVMSSQSGLTVSVSGERLASNMEEKGYSLSGLSRRVGVSRQMIVRYRTGKSEISVRKAAVMQRIFGDSIFEKVNIFSSVADGNQENPSLLAKKYENLGFRAADTRKAPFDIIARKESEIILTGVGDTLNPAFVALTKLIDADKLMIFERKKLKEKSVPSMSKSEFLEMETARELIRFVREFD